MYKEVLLSKDKLMERIEKNKVDVDIKEDFPQKEYNILTQVQGNSALKVIDSFILKQLYEEKQYFQDQNNLEKQEQKQQIIDYTNQKEIEQAEAYLKINQLENFWDQILSEKHNEDTQNKPLINDIDIKNIPETNYNQNIQSNRNKSLFDKDDLKNKTNTSNISPNFLKNHQHIQFSPTYAFKPIIEQSIEFQQEVKGQPTSPQSMPIGAETVLQEQNQDLVDQKCNWCTQKCNLI